MRTIKKFTDALVRNLKVTGNRYDVTEGNGFYLRVSATGKKSWVYVYWFNNKSKRMTVGYYPSLSVADARKLVVDASLLKDKNIDPVQYAKDIEETKRLEQQRELQTFEWLANDFYTRYIEKNRKAPQQIKQQIDADIIPLLGKSHIDEVTTRQITLALEKIVDRGSPVHANKVLSTIKQIFTYGVSKGITERNPAMLIKSKNIGGVEIPRDRYLSYEEIKTIWLYFSDRSKHNIHPATIIGIKILLLTGVRTGSLIKAQFKELDFDNSLWVIPAKHLKLKKTEVHKPHKVHLTKLTKQLFLELKELSSCDYVLPSPNIQNEDKPVNDKIFSHAIRKTRGNIEGITEDFNAHDFRTTISTHLADMGISPHISELCLGHKLPGIMATYNKHEYLDERKEALDLWSDKIEMMVTNSNVIMLNTQTK